MRFVLKKILFICTGNTCRSAMAEGFFNIAIKENPLLSESFTSFSAGIMAMDGDNASNNAILALKEEWNIDISLHKAKAIRYEYIKKSYLILTMTKAHKDAVLQLFPEMKSKVYTLKEYATSLLKESSLEESDKFYGTLDNMGQNDFLKNYSFDFNYDFAFDMVNHWIFINIVHKT